MAARKRPVRSLSILLLAVLVNASVLMLVFRVMPHSSDDGRYAVVRKSMNSRSASPRPAAKRSAGGVASQDSSAAAKSKAANIAQRQADNHGEETIELDEAEAAKREQAELKHEMPRDQEETAEPSNDPRAAVLAAYLARRAQARDVVDDQKQLASWCDRQGLWDEAKNHWEAVLRLDPGVEAARKRLGYRHHQGDWVLDPALAESVLQNKADTFWMRKLSIAHKQIDGKDRRDSARAGSSTQSP